MEAMTPGQRYTTAVRRYLHVGPRTRRRRAGGDLTVRVLEIVEAEAQYPGYFNTELGVALKPAIAVMYAWRKHVDGFRVDPVLRYRLTTMSPWELIGLIGNMIDAGVTNSGEGERYFARMARE